MDKQLLIEVLQMYRDNEQSLENTLRAIDVYAQSRQADVSGSLPPDVLSILNEVMYIFSAYEEGTVGKDISNKSKDILKKYK